MIGGPWYNTSICKKLHRKLFEIFIRNAITDIYNIMCSIDAHEKEHQSSCDDGISGGSFTPPSNSTTEALYLLGTTMDFIGCWRKAREQNFIERCNMYAFNMISPQKIPVELPKQTSPKEKRKSLLHVIGGDWYVKKSVQKLPPLKRRELRKKPQKRRIK